MIGRRKQAPKGSKSRANKTGNYALLVMAQQKLKSTGPMGMQPSYHGSTMPFPLQPAMPALVGADAPAGDAGGTAPAKPKLTRPQAVRIAKARIMRRNSLRKQRLAQKG